MINKILTTTTRMAAVLAAAAVPFFFAGTTARATTMQYSTYSAWASAVSNPIELDLTRIMNGANYSTASGKTLLPSSGPALPFVFTGPLTAGGYQLSGGDYTVNYKNYVSLLGPAGGAGSILITLPSSGESAFSIGIGSNGSGTAAALTFSDGENFTVPVTAGQFEAFSVSVSHPINWVSVYIPGTQPVITDFDFASSKLSQDPAMPASPAAEGATLYLIGGGLLSLFGARRKLLGQFVAFGG